MTESLDKIKMEDKNRKLESIVNCAKWYLRNRLDAYDDQEIQSMIRDDIFTEEEIQRELERKMKISKDDGTRIIYPHVSCHGLQSKEPIFNILISDINSSFGIGDMNELEVWLFIKDIQDQLELYLDGKQES